MKSEVKMWFIIILVIPIYAMRDVEKIERITALIPKQSTIKENERISTSCFTSAVIVMSKLCRINFHRL